jgi:excisionase family DNA binding protein
MKTNSLNTLEIRLTNIESELREIKGILKEVLSNHVDGKSEVDDRIMNIREAAQLLGIEKHILYGKVRNGELPSFRIGKQYKFRRTELVSWLDKQGMASSNSIEEYVNKYMQKRVLKG